MTGNTKTKILEVYLEQEKLMGLLQQCSQSKRLKLLKTRVPSLDYTVLESLARHHHDSLPQVLTILSPRDLLAISNMRTHNGLPMWLMFINNAELMANLFRQLPPKEQESLLLKKYHQKSKEFLSLDCIQGVYLSDKRGKTLLQILTYFPVSLLAILETVDASIVLKASQSHDRAGNTLLHLVASNPDSLQAVISLYPDKTQATKALKQTNRQGQSVLYYAASSKLSLDIILPYYQKSELENALKSRPKYGKSMLRQAINDPSALQFLLSLYPQESREQVLLEPDNRGLTLLDDVLYKPFSLRVILLLLTTEARLKLLNIKDEHGRSLLHRLANTPGSLHTLLEALTNRISPRHFFTYDCLGKTPLHITPQNTAAMAEMIEAASEACFSLFTLKDKRGHTPLSLASEHPETLGLMIRAMNEEQCLLALSQEVSQGKKCLHLIIKQPAMVNIVAQALSGETMAKALALEDKQGNTPLHYISEHPEECLKLLARVPEEKRLSLITKTNIYGSTLLHRCAAEHQYLDAVLQTLSPQEQSEALKCCINRGETPFHTAVRDPLSIAILIGYIPSTERYAVYLNHQSRRHILQAAAHYPQSFTVLLESLTLTERLMAIMHADARGKNLFDEIKDSPQSCALLLDCLDIEALLSTANADLESVCQSLLALRMYLIKRGIYESFDHPQCHQLEASLNKIHLLLTIEKEIKRRPDMQLELSELRTFVQQDMVDWVKQ